MEDITQDNSVNGILIEALPVYDSNIIEEQINGTLIDCRPIESVNFAAFL